MIQDKTLSLARIKEQLTNLAMKTSQCNNHNKNKSSNNKNASFGINTRLLTMSNSTNC
jgi:hypothetical protein